MSFYLEEGHDRQPMVYMPMNALAHCCVQSILSRSIQEVRLSGWCANHYCPDKLIAESGFIVVKSMLQHTNTLFIPCLKRIKVTVSCIPTACLGCVNSIHVDKYCRLPSDLRHLSLK